MTDDEPDLEPLAVPRPWAADPVAAAPDPEPSPRPAHRTSRAVIALVVAMLIAGIVGFAVASHAESDTPFQAAFTPTPGSSVPGSSPAPTSTDPDAAVLRSLGVQQQDVDSTHTIELLAGGDQVVGQTTLDLCNGTFPSESLRTARFQVLDSDTNDDVVLSTESVLYRNPSATEQAFAELQRVRANCPHTPVPSKSPTGSTVTTTFRPAPDTKWPTTPGVDRLAYDFDSVDLQGKSDHSIAVYLRRGRVLMGVYFASPDGPQAPVEGHTTVQSIVQLFEKRLAALPASVVNRHA
jgi:hypothetical protein